MTPSLERPRLQRGQPDRALPGRAATASRPAPSSLVPTTSLGLIFVTLACVAPAQAQIPTQPLAQAQAQAPSGREHQWNLPAGPLGATLVRIAETSGASVLIPPELVRERSAPAVTGALTVEQAIAAAVAGQGLEVFRLGNGTLTIRPLPRSRAAATTERTLAPVVVSAARARETATSPVSGYIAQRAATATRTDTALSETPQSISVVTRDQIIDQSPSNVQEAIAYSAGVNVSAADSRGDGFLVRGASPQYYLDGLPLYATGGFYDMLASAEIYTLERVEVLRGPAGMLFGAGTPAGLVSMVSKRPLAETQREIGLSVGNHDRRQIHTDLTGPLTKDGQWTYRLIGVFRDAGTQVDHVPDDRRLLAPSLTWRPSAATELTLQGLWQQNKGGTTGQYLPLSGTLQSNPNGNLPTSRFIGEPGDYNHQSRRTFGWLFEHRFDERTVLRQNVRFARNSLSEFSHMAEFWNHRGGWPEDPINQRLLPRSASRAQMQTRVGAIDNHVETRFDTGAVQHRVLVGLDYMRQSETQASGGVSDLIDAFDPAYGVGERPVIDYDYFSRMTTRNLGLYAQDQLRYGNWILVGGLRHDRSSSKADDSERESIRANTRRLGLLYAFPSGWSPYLSYTESFTPQTGRTEEGALYKPLRGKQTEAGIKYLPADGRLSANLAVYHLKEKNREIADVDNPRFGLQVDSSTNRGVEVEVTAKVSPSLALLGYYSFLDRDRKLGGLPRHQAAIWGRYGFSVAGVSGFTTGAGVRYISAQNDVTVTETGPRVPSATLLDLMFAYDIPQWRFALNVNNATDRTWFTGCYLRGDCWYGMRRTVVATATYRF